MVCHLAQPNMWLSVTAVTVCSQFWFLLEQWQIDIKRVLFDYLTGSIKKDPCQAAEMAQWGNV